MRQAGRALPEYRALKEKHTFLQLAQTPELATEVTLQPIRRFGFDAAILFSDILVIAEAMGQPYRFKEQGGIAMEFLLETEADLDRLDETSVTDRLNYVAEALRRIKVALAGNTALIGFAGSPWTLANYMLEGGGVREYSKAKALFYSNPRFFGRLMEKLTLATTAYLRMQIDSGAEAVQIFDSLGGELSDGAFGEASGRWVRAIVQALEQRVPVIVFSRGTHGAWQDLVNTGAQVLGVDWNCSLAEVAGQLPERVAVQGNLDPFLLTTTPDRVQRETERILKGMKGRAGHIFNLGHGVPPNSSLENIQSLVDTVRRGP